MSRFVALTSTRQLPIVSVMFGFGPTELLIILVIVIVIFGASRLPQIGDGLGKGIKNFRGALKEPPEIDVTPSNDEDEDEDESKS